MPRLYEEHLARVGGLREWISLHLQVVALSKYVAISVNPNSLESSAGVCPHLELEQLHITSLAICRRLTWNVQQNTKY